MNYTQFTNRYSYKAKVDAIGEGGFGKVVKAYDNTLGRFVAIKISKVIISEGREFSLKDEMKAIGSLPPHPNIAHYEDIHSFEMPDGDYDFAIMQYYPDGNLAEFIQNKQLSPETKEALCIKILQGLDYLHQHSIVHRDLKPANILIQQHALTQEFIPKITDFGLSKVADDIKKSVFNNSIAGGTYSYCSPEQIRGTVKIKFNTDLWAYGTIVYEIFTGEPLFNAPYNKGATAVYISEITNQVLHSDFYNKLDVLPDKWKRIANACLIRDNTQRVQTTQDLLNLLNNSNISDSTIVYPTEKTKPNNNDRETIIITKPEKSDTETTIIETNYTQKEHNLKLSIVETNKKTKDVIIKETENKQDNEFPIDKFIRFFKPLFTSNGRLTRRDYWIRLLPALFLFFINWVFIENSGGILIDTISNIILYFIIYFSLLRTRINDCTSNLLSSSKSKLFIKSIAIIFFIVTFLLILDEYFNLRLDFFYTLYDEIFPSISLITSFIYIITLLILGFIKPVITSNLHGNNPRLETGYRKAFIKNNKTHLLFYLIIFIVSIFFFTSGSM